LCILRLPVGRRPESATHGVHAGDCESGPRHGRLFLNWSNEHKPEKIMPTPIMSIDGVSYQVRIRWLLHGQQCENVLNFTSHGSQDLVENLLIPVLGCITDNLLPILSNEAQLLGAVCKNVTGSVAQEVEKNATGTGLGTLSTDSLPSTNAAVVRLKTTHPGRTGRGFMKLLGIPEDHTESSKLDAVFIAAALAFLACMAAAFIAGDPPAAVRFDWCVRSRKDNAFYPIIDTSVNPIIGTQRSRKVR
jgi:hypothetical protein